MLRYKTQTRPGLVALYDIRPENGARTGATVKKSTVLVPLYTVIVHLDLYVICLLQGCLFTFVFLYYICW